MLENNEIPQKSGSIVDKIENQLQDILTKKKEEIERSLEERIRKERDDAQRKLEEIEKDYESEKETLVRYKSKFSEIETRRDEIKKRIKTHLDMAVRYQTEISGLTGKTLEELKKVGELNRLLDEYQKQAESELSGMKKDLESKYGIVAALPRSNGPEDMDFNLEQELTKLKKIKELLGSKENGAEAAAEVPHIPEEPVMEKPVMEEPEKEKPDYSAPPLEESQERGDVPREEMPPASPSPMPSHEEEQIPEPRDEEPPPEIFEERIQEREEKKEFPKEEPPETARREAEYEQEPPERIEPPAPPAAEPEEPQIEIQSPFISQPEVEFEPVEEEEGTQVDHPAFAESADEPPRGAEEITFSQEEPAETRVEQDVLQAEAPAPEKEEKTALDQREQMPPLEANFQDVFEKLEQFRKGVCKDDNGEVSYFQTGKKVIIDGECLMSSLGNSLDGAKNLYKKLNETESPKEQFFIKQDIIRHQEVLRKLMLSSIKMSDKESCTLPLYTREILNVEVLKTILEKVSMENWSDEQDFVEFDKYAKSLKDAYYARITPPARYIQSILEELAE
jgi:hypothetical protein